MRNPIQVFLNKRRNKQRMAFFKLEREMVRKAMERVAAASVDVVEEIVDLPAVISQDTGFMYRVVLPGANELYDAITQWNYRKLVNGMGHLEHDDEFLLAMIVIDKCEEYLDYESMIKAFNIFEYVVRHRKNSSEVISFARQYVIEIRQYLTELGHL
jgi:hypothetical protein